MKKCILGWSNLTYPSHSNPNRRVQTEIIYSGLLVHQKSQPLEPANIFSHRKVPTTILVGEWNFLHSSNKKKKKKKDKAKKDRQYRSIKA